MYTDVFFPMDTEMVRFALKDVVNWKLMGLNLDISWTELSKIESDNVAFPDHNLKKERVIQLWMSNEPTWPSMVEALREPSIALYRSADEISTQHSMFYSLIIDFYIHLYSTIHADLPLQCNILDEENSTIRPNKDFLKSFADIISSRWQCFASPLSLTSEDIVSIKRETRGAEPTRQALVMLQKWAAHETATYGQLRERLRTRSVFHI